MKEKCEKIRYLSTNIRFFLKNAKSYPHLSTMEIMHNYLTHVFKTDANLHACIG